MVARLASVVLLAIAGMAVYQPVAHAHDSLAPAGSAHNWLPDEAWVHRHWIPFDEQTLKAKLALHGRDLHAYLYNDHRTLAMLARIRGLDVNRLADELVAPWQGITDAQRAVLRERSLRILTQGHLAQHMFFHVFHGRILHSLAHELFGMHGSRYRALRELGLSLVDIARRGGISKEALRSSIARLIVADANNAIASHEAWPMESRHIRNRTLAWLPCWIDRPAARLDATNPYGKNRLLHGLHASSWPATAGERRSDERRVDRRLRRMPASCWPHPPAWDWSAYRSRAS